MTDLAMVIDSAVLMDLVVINMAMMVESEVVEVMGSVILKMAMAVAIVKVMDLAMAMDLVKVMDLVVILMGWKVYLWKMNRFQMTSSSLCTQEQLLQSVQPIVLS